MTNEQSIKWLKEVLRTTDFQYEQMEQAVEMAIQALSQEPCSNCCNGNQIEKAKLCQKSYLAGMEHKQEPCDDAISREAAEDKLLKLCNELEGIFANIRMQNQDESVCGLCEYDCPAPYECPGFDIEDCFKLADEIRHKWQSTKDIPSVTQKSDNKYRKEAKRWKNKWLKSEAKKSEAKKSEAKKSGKWICEDFRKEEYVLAGKCSVCGRVRVIDEFCSHCGADMRGDAE